MFNVVKSPVLHKHLHVHELVLHSAQALNMTCHSSNNYSYNCQEISCPMAVSVNSFNRPYQQNAVKDDRRSAGET